MLSRDSAELSSLIRFLSAERGGRRFALVGHSTGCQICCHFLRHGEDATVDLVAACALQAPVSDREGAETEPLYADNLGIAQDLVARGEGAEMMPRAAFWAPICAERFLSLQGRGGEDDFFSSDLTDAELGARLRHVGDKLRRCDARSRILVAYSGRDEYVPEHVDRDRLLTRLCAAIEGDEEGVAVPLMLDEANHNLSKGEGDGERFVATFEDILNNLK